MNSEDVEHERKFVVRDTSVLPPADEGASIVQGYLGAEDGYSVRIRLIPAQDVYVLTVKGPLQGITRTELETSVPREVAEALFQACGAAIVEKIRHPAVGPDGKMWTIDAFIGANDGLVLAEVELDDAAQGIALPDWCGEEVTHEARFYNENLSRTPYSTWTPGAGEVA